MLSVHKLPKAVKDREKYGSAIASIQSKNPKLNKKQVFLKYDDTFSDDGIREINLDAGDKFSPQPLRTTTNRVYVSGPSGSGKSTFCSKYIENYRKVYPDDSVYLISQVEDDDVLDKLPYLERIDLESLHGVGMGDFENSLVIFDDVTSIKDKELKKTVFNLRDQILTMGRHFNTSILVTSHLFSNFKETRIVLLECRDIVIFPRSGGKSAIRKGLTSYVGLDNNQLEKIFKQRSRWVMLRKSSPSFVMSERSIYLLD